MFPQRSPMPSAVPCIRWAPSSTAARALGIAEAAVAVAVPVDLHVLAARLHDLRPDEADQLAHALRRGVPHRVGEADAARAAADRGAVERPQRLGRGAGGVLGHVHHGQPLRHGEAHRLLRGAQHPLERPALGELPDRRGADEGGRLDRDARRAGRSPRSARRRRARCARRSWARSAAGRRRSRAPAPPRRPPPAGPRPGSPMSAAAIPSSAIRWRSADLVLDARVGDRGRLEPVAQRLVVQLHPRRGV